MGDKFCLEPAFRQTQLHLTHLLFNLVTAVTSAINVVHVAIEAQRYHRSRKLLTEFLPQQVNRHVGLVATAAHAVPSRLHAVDLWLLRVGEGLVVQEQGVREGLVTQFELVVHFRDVGTPSMLMCTKADEHLRDLGEHVLPFREYLVKP